MGDDTAMESSPPPDPAEINYVALDKLPLDNWQFTLEQMNIRLEVVQASYSPGAALSSRAWERSKFCTQHDICPPEFDPACFGVPLMWNSADAGSEFHGYQVCVGWGKNVKWLYPEKSQFVPDDTKEYVFHFRDFLAIRPLSRDLPRYIEHWQKGSSIAAEQSRDAPRPIAVEGRGGARSCADLFDWDRVKPYVHTFQKGGNKVEGFIVPLKTGMSICDGALQPHDIANDWEVGYHATNAYALYSQLYHGKLKQSKSAVPGERACFRGDGVYLFSPKDLDSSFGYSTGTVIGWHGVVFHFVWELAFKNPLHRRLGSAKNQVVVEPGNVRLGNLIVIPRTGKQLYEGDGFYYFKPPIIENSTDNIWCPCYEANPINPFTALCRKDEESVANPFAVKYVASFAKGSHSGGTVAGKPEAKGPATEGSNNPMQVDVDNTSIKNVMAKALETTVESVVGKIVRADDAWRNFACKMIDMIANSMDAERRGLILQGTSQCKHPAIVMFRLMHEIGDHDTADSLLKDMNNDVMPPEHPVDLKKGFLVVSGDSVICFKKTKGSVIPENEVRYLFGYEHYNEKWTTGGVVEMRVGLHSWRFRMQWPDPSPETVYFPHCAMQLFKDAKDIMLKNVDVWTIEGVAINPATSNIRPRVGILYWTINEGMYNEFDPDHECWKAIDQWNKVRHLFLDRVAIVIIGTAASWTIRQSWDRWLNHARMILKSKSIPVFDGTSVLHRMTKDNGFHFVTTDDGKKAMAEYTRHVYQYLVASMPRTPAWYHEVIDQYDELTFEWKTKSVKKTPQPAANVQEKSVGSEKSAVYDPKDDALASSGESIQITKKQAIHEVESAVVSEKSDVATPSAVAVQSPGDSDTQVVSMDVEDSNVKVVSTSPLVVAVQSPGDRSTAVQFIDRTDTPLGKVVSPHVEVASPPVVAVQSPGVQQSSSSSYRDASWPALPRSTLKPPEPVNALRSKESRSISLPPPPPPVPPAQTGVEQSVKEQGGKGKGKGKDNPNIKCFRCQGNHHIRDCPDGPKCFKCGKPNHMARDCKEEVADLRHASKTCHKCGKPGHIAKNCEVFPPADVRPGKPRSAVDTGELPMDEKFNDRFLTPVSFEKGEGLLPREEKSSVKHDKLDDDGASSDSSAYSFSYYRIPTTHEEVRDQSIVQPFREAPKPMSVETAEPILFSDRVKEKVDRTVEQLTKTYGKGFTMLIAKGYNGMGLGKHEDGVGNPIIPKRVKGRRGLTTYADKFKYPSLANFLSNFDVDMPSEGDTPLDEVEDRLGIGVDVGDEYEQSEASYVSVSAASEISDIAEENATVADVLAEDISEQIVEEEASEQEPMSVLPVSVQIPKDFAKGSMAHFTAIRVLIKQLKATNIAQILAAIHGNPDLSHLDTDYDNLIMIFQYEDLAARFTDFELNFDLEMFMCLRRGFDEQKASGKFEEDYTLETFILEWCCRNELVIGDPVPDNMTINWHVGNLQMYLSPFFELIDTEHFCEALKIKRKQRRERGESDFILDIMRDLGFLIAKDSSDEAVAKYWEEFIAQKPTRVIDKDVFVHNWSNCREDVIHGRCMTLEEWLVDKGLLTIQESVFEGRPKESTGSKPSEVKSEAAVTGSTDIRTNVGRVRHYGDGSVSHTSEEGTVTNFASSQMYNEWVEKNRGLVEQFTSQALQSVKEENAAFDAPTASSSQMPVRRSRWGGPAHQSVAESSGGTVAVSTRAKTDFVLPPPPPIPPSVDAERIRRECARVGVPVPPPAPGRTAAQPSVPVGSGIPVPPAVPVTQGTAGSSTTAAANVVIPGSDISWERMNIPELRNYELIERQPRTGPQMSWEQTRYSREMFVLIPWTPDLRAVNANGRLIPGPPRVQSPPPHLKLLGGTDPLVGSAQQATQSAPSAPSTEDVRQPEATQGEKRKVGVEKKVRVPDYERTPMTIAEREELKRQVEESSKENIDEANKLFPPMANWKDTAMEKDRIAAREQAIIEDGGHIATDAELEQFQSIVVPVHDKLTKIVVSLLRTRKAGKSVSDIPHKFDISNLGWVSCRDLINAVKDEIVGSQFNISRLIALVRADEYQRMQMWIQQPRPGQAISERSFVYVRAVSAHHESCHVDHRRIYPEKAKFKPDSTPDAYRGPDHVFYYTDMAGLSAIWKEDAITPSCCRFGIRSKAFVFCSPVNIEHPDCPEACKIHKEKFKYQITLDFRMMTWDNMNCFYTAEGLVAIRTDAIGSAYICQIISCETGAFVYLRNFKIANWHWTGKDNISVADTRHERGIQRFHCFVCNTSLWVGSIMCTHCYSPILLENRTEHGFPRFTTQVGLDRKSVEAWNPNEQKHMKGLIAKGRRVQSMKFNSTFGIRPPPPEEESSRTGLARRSFEGQGKRTDDDIKRKHKMEINRGYTVYRGSIEDRIARDIQLRLRLARAVVNCAHHFTPAAILMSPLHRLAYKTAIENGEITYENVGGRNTVNTNNGGEDE